MAEYTQTHVVPIEGLPAWAGPDGSTPPAANLDPGLDVMVLERRADWALVARDALFPPRRHRLAYPGVVE